MTDEVLTVLRTWRRFVDESEGGVPRYTIKPGAGLNQLVEWTDEVLRKNSPFSQEAAQ
jgi:hypothetical protein